MPTELPASLEATLAAGKISFNPDTFRWDGIEEMTYKFSLGNARGLGWKGVTRHTFGGPPLLAGGFELRYFELAPGGYSSIEKHQHVHLIMVLRGNGRALVGDKVFDVKPMDMVTVSPLTPHRWLNESDAPFGFLCPVDADRDSAQPLSDEEWEALQANPATSPYLF